MGEGKLTTLAKAVAAIGDMAVIAPGGSTLHRIPAAVVHELVRQERRGLTVVKTAGGYDLDLLCGSGCVSALAAAYVGFENYGLAPSFRRAVESGRVRLEEHT